MLIQLQAMRTVWHCAVVFAGVGWLLVWLEKEVALRSKLNTKFGLEERKKAAKVENIEQGNVEDNAETAIKRSSTSE